MQVNDSSLESFKTRPIPGGEPSASSDMKGHGVVVLTNGVNGDDLYPEIVKSVAFAYKWPNREQIDAYKPRVEPHELYHSQAELTAEATKALWKNRSGSYVFREGEKVHHLDVNYDEKTEKMVLEIYDEGNPQKKSLHFIPVGPSVAYHPGDAQGWSDVARFGEEKAVPYVEIFGARHTLVKASAAVIPPFRLHV